MIVGSRKARRFGQISTPMETLESRQLLSVTVTQSLGNVTGGSGSTSNPIDLSADFNDPTIPTVVRIGTQLGNIDLQLLDTQKPITVANFLNYVHRGDYDSTFIHRSTAASTGLQVIQGGGYSYPTFTHIATDPPIVNEFTTNGIVSNTRGTIAMAKTSDPDSATSEWFINETDNSAALDNTSNSGGFTVFGNVINNTLTTVDAIGAVPTIAAGDPFGEIPLINYTADDLNNGKQPTASNLLITTVETLPELTFTAVSSNPAVVMPTVSGNKLTLAYGDVPGAATVTVTATDANSQSVVSTFNAENLLNVTIGASGAKSAVYTDADGTVTTVSLKGAGSAKVQFDGTNLDSSTAKGVATVIGTGVSVTALTATGTTAKTSLTISTAGGDGSVTLGGITADGALSSLSAKTTVLAGTFSTGGAIGKLDLGSADHSQITLGGAATDKPSSITVGSLTDTNVTASAPIKSLKATSFAGADENFETLSAPSIGTLSVSGNLVEQVTSTAAIKSISVGGNFSGGLQAPSVGSISVKGNVVDANLTLNGAFAAKATSIKSLKVSGAITTSTIATTSNIGAVTASSMSGSTIFAGVTSVSLPSAAGDFANAASIGSVKISAALADSKVAASKLGKVTLGSLTISNGGESLGFAAHTLAALTTLVGDTKVSLKKLAAQSDVTAQLKGVDLADARVTII